jgi:hypothetical protein
MELWEKIMNAYPELTDVDFSRQGTIGLRNDSDGLGDFIEKWEYSEPIPKGLKLGKPSV